MENWFVSLGIMMRTPVVMVARDLTYYSTLGKQNNTREWREFMEIVKKFATVNADKTFASVEILVG